MIAILTLSFRPRSRDNISVLKKITFPVWKSSTRARLFAVAAQSSGMEVNNELLGDQNNMKLPNAVSCFVGVGQSHEALNQWLTGLILRLRLTPSNLRVVRVHRRKKIIVKKWRGGLGSEKRPKLTPTLRKARFLQAPEKGYFFFGRKAMIRAGSVSKKPPPIKSRQ